MDAFEELMAQLLRAEGYWTRMSFKVELTKEEKHLIGRPSTPRWEIDILAYKGSTNEVLAVECKSFLDSTGVVFRRGCFETEKRYKLFNEPKTCEVVLSALEKQLVKLGCCRAKPKVRLALATGKIATKTNRDELRIHFQANDWTLFDDAWIRDRLTGSAKLGYENEVATVVSKILLRHRDGIKS